MANLSNSRTATIQTQYEWALSTTYWISFLVVPHNKNEENNTALRLGVSKLSRKLGNSFFRKSKGFRKRAERELPDFILFIRARRYRQNGKCGWEAEKWPSHDEDQMGRYQKAQCQGRRYPIRWLFVQDTIIWVCGGRTCSDEFACPGSSRDCAHFSDASVPGFHFYLYVPSTMAPQTEIFGEKLYWPILSVFGWYSMIRIPLLPP
jgi:hypothetical protein